VPAAILASLRWLTLGLTLLLAGHAWADATHIELIELKGRSAEELIPLLKPMVEPGGALSGSGYRLIVRATPAQHREIRRLLDQLDQPPRRLLITVHMGELSQQERQGGSLYIDRQIGDVGVGLGSPAQPGERGLDIGQQDQQGSASVRLHSTRSVTDAANRQQVQALEGETAYIAAGSERPYPSQIETWRGPRGAGGSVAFDYKQASTGFYAVARIRDDQVVIQVSPQKEAFERHGGGAVESQRIQTTVSGPLGSWIQLGGVGASVSQRDSSPGRSVSTQQTQSQPVWLKVDILP
jgi:hypothetical protein